MAGNDTAVCWFGAERLLPLLNEFKKEIDGVKTESDIEYVHRMRVTSRRLRTIFPIFAECFSRHSSRRFLKDTKKVSRALGAVRDADVLHDFLEEFRNKPTAGTGPENDPVFCELRENLREQRRKRQDPVLAAFDTLEKGETVDAIRAAARKIVKTISRNTKVTRNRKDLHRLAAKHIGATLDSLLPFDAVAHDPDDTAGHHAMRIAVKKFRYTIEVFQPLYGDRFIIALEILKRLQQELGEIHDCDTWIQILGAVCEHNDARQRVGKSKFPRKILIETATPTIIALFKNRQDRRQECYLHLIFDWENFIQSNVPGMIRAIIADVDSPVESGKELSAHTPKHIHKGKTNDRIVALTTMYPEGLAHAQQVTRLALMLFDNLTSLHQYGKKERILLEYAGMLHDIGWICGQEEHQASGAELILKDRTLPITWRERTIVSLLIRYHGKSLPKKPDPDLSTLKQKDRTRVYALAALLRIADGFDYSHTNRVRAIRCIIRENEVSCLPEWDGDGSTERARALSKSDLFKQVFGRRFLIL